MCEDEDRTGFSIHDPTMPIEVSTGFGKPQVIVANFNRDSVTFVIEGTPTACINKARQIGAATFNRPWHFTAIQLDPIAPDDLRVTEVDRIPYHGWIFTAHAEIDKEA